MWSKVAKPRATVFCNLSENSSAIQVAIMFLKFVSIVLRRKTILYFMIENSWQLVWLHLYFMNFK